MRFSSVLWEVMRSPFNVEQPSLATSTGLGYRTYVPPCLAVRVSCSRMADAPTWLAAIGTVGTLGATTVAVFLQRRDLIDQRKQFRFELQRRRDEEIAERAQTLGLALDEIVTVRALLTNDRLIALPAQAQQAALLLLSRHSPKESFQSIREARRLVTGYNAAIIGKEPDPTTDGVKEEIDAECRSAKVEIENLIAALSAPQATGARWLDLP